MLGTIPGVIALVGCSNYPKGTKEAYLMAKEFADRGYIVVTSGCMAMDMSLYKDEDGKTIWEQYQGASTVGTSATPALVSPTLTSPMQP